MPPAPGNIVYLHPGFTLRFRANSGEVTTFFPGGASVDSMPGTEAGYHARRVGISPECFHLMRELAHHLVGIYVYERLTSARIARDAGIIPPGDDFHRRESTLALALAYHALGHSALLKEGPGQPDYDPLLLIATRTDLEHLVGVLQWLVSAPVGSVLDLRNAVW